MLWTSTVDHSFHDVIDPSSSPSRPLHRFRGPELSEVDFKRVWATGEPLVVSGLLQKFNIAWDPEYFKEKYGENECTIVDCSTNDMQKSTVGDFFDLFGDHDRGDSIKKLKASTIVIFAPMRSL